MAQEEIKTLKEFWPFYLSQHRHPVNRALHVVGTTGILVFVGLAVYLQNWYLLIGVLVCPYAFAWFGHFVVEKNRPATFTYPFKSLISDFKMYWYILTFQFEKELKRTGG